MNLDRRDLDTVTNMRVELTDNIIDQPSIVEIQGENKGTIFHHASLLKS